MLKAIHAYASDFYSRNLGEGAVVDFHSLDETALLCMGILLEEMADGVLGDTGDLAFTEGEAVEPEARRGDAMGRESSGNVSTGEVQAMSVPTKIMTEEDSASPVPRSSKRRKTRHHGNGG